jgi:hypothetical protein
LFFSTVAVSLVILIIFFSLFFKNVDLNFNTRLPESAPEIGRQFGNGQSMNQDSKADGLMRATINVPPEMQEPAVNANAKKKDDTDGADDSDLPPISDDAVLQHNNQAPIAVPPNELSTPSGEPGTATAPAPRTPKPSKRATETAPSTAPSNPSLQEESAPVNAGPPVPGQ